MPTSSSNDRISRYCPRCRETVKYDRVDVGHYVHLKCGHKLSIVQFKKE